MSLNQRVGVIAVAAVIGISACEEAPERDAPAPFAAQIRCEEEGARALTPRVQPQDDGIHISIDNQSGARQFYIRAADDEGWNQGGRLGDSGVSKVKTTMPPGQIWIGCFERASDIPYNESAPEFAEVRVVDREGLWIAPDLDCSEEEGGRFLDGEAEGAAPEDVDALIRSEVPGIEADDAFVKPGYPGTEWHGELRHVVRDGETIAAVNVYQQLSRWEVSVRRCQGIGVGS
jgi:hypothetical protein